MTNYLINFSIYTMAMIGVIFIALYTFKAVSGGGFSRKTSMLNVIDTMKLSARKTLYVIKAENEKFLIAADIDKTSLIAKLGENSEQIIKKREDKGVSLKSFDGIESINEFSSVINFNEEKAKKGPMMRELAKKLNTL
jgi:flagellar biogenesis protein FliO